MDVFKVQPYALNGGSSDKTGLIYTMIKIKKRKMLSKFITDLECGDEIIFMMPGGSGYGRKEKKSKNGGG